MPSQNPRLAFQQYLEGNDRPYKCQFCSKAYKKSSHLKQHVRSGRLAAWQEEHVAWVGVYFDFYICGFSLPRSHTGERPFKCVQCSRGFASSGVLKAHIRTHSGLKAYKCLMCDTTFTTSGSLRRHMTTHSDLRPYMCPYCQKTFKSSPNCRKHMKTHRFGVSSCSFWRFMSQLKVIDWVFLVVLGQIWISAAAAAPAHWRPLKWGRGPRHAGGNRGRPTSSANCFLGRAAEHAGTGPDWGGAWKPASDAGGASEW